MSKAIGPYSNYRKHQNLYFISGQLPISFQTGIFPETISEQTRCSLENLKFVVESIDLSMKDVLKTTVFLADITDFEAMNKEYATFFEETFPARSAIEVANLPKGALVEIEAIVGGIEYDDKK